MNRALQCFPSFQNFLEERGFEKGPVEKWEGSDKNFRNWPKIKWPIYIINH